VGFCGGQNGAGVGFLRVLRFPLPIFIPPIAPKIILIYYRGLYNRPMAAVPGTRDLNRHLGTQYRPTNNNNNNNNNWNIGKIACHSSYCSANIFTVMKDDKVGVTYSTQGLDENFSKYSTPKIIPFVLCRDR
jgi:hypothetical protein